MKKTYTWDGKKVSRTTYFRMKRKLPFAKGSSKAVAVAAHVSTSVPEVNYGAKASPKDAPAILGDELVRDFMVMVGSQPEGPEGVGLGSAVMVPPRTFKAIIRILRNIGY